MNKNIVFTICAKNYIGLAEILGKSVLANCVDSDFLIFVADEVSSEELDFTLSQNVILARNNLDILNEKWIDMSFKYNLTEFCTSIKPAAFSYLFNKLGYEKAIYLDPDIYVFSSLDPVFSMLDDKSVVITPHITDISDDYKGDLPDTDFLGNGIYNLGFLGLKNSIAGLKLLKWWHSKLLDHCFIDPYENCFTDQKWMDYLPALLDSNDLLVTRHLGMNVAPWNFFERKIIHENSIFCVSNRLDDDKSQVYPLIFVHFSGYDYNFLKRGIISQNNISDIKGYQDISILMDTYKNAIQSESDSFDKYIKLSYTYNFFKNGDSISAFHRRIYRSLNSRGEFYPDPFSIDEKSFYQRLKEMRMLKQKLNMDKVSKSSLSGVRKKLIIVNKVMRLFYKLIGLSKYILILRLFRPYSRYESQIHLFDSKYDDNNIF